MAEKLLNILEDIQKGISPSYMGKFNRICRFDITNPGYIQANVRYRTEYPFWGQAAFTALTFTVNSSTNVFTASADVSAVWSKGQSVVLTTTTTLPDPLAGSTVYYVFAISGSTFKLASSLAHLRAETAVNLTDTGTGTHTVTASKLGEIVKFDSNDSDVFAIDALGSTQNLYMRNVASGDAWIRLNAHGKQVKGMAVWRNYLITSNEVAKLAAFGPLSDYDTATWTYDIASITGIGTKPMKVMSNGILYVGDGRGVSSLEEVTGSTFDPGTGATFTFLQHALKIPKDEAVGSLEEYNFKLAVGTGQGSRFDAKIYFWDTVSPSFEQVLKTNGSWVWNMLAYNGMLYFITSDVSSRSDGQVYVTNGYQIQKSFQIPKSSGNAQQLKSDYPFIIERNALVEWNDRIYVAVGRQYGAGIYEFSPETGHLTVAYTLHNNKEGNTIPGVGQESVTYGALLARENDLLMGVYYADYDGDYYWIQSLVQTDYRLTTNAYFETGLWTVGNKMQPKTYSFFEVQLGKELADGQTITLKYRNNLTDTYTTIGTMSYTADGAIATKIIENSSVSGDQIQFKVELDISAANTITPTNPNCEIKAIYVY